MASVLSGAWRCLPPDLRISANEFAAVIPLLLDSGAGAIGWGRIRQSELGTSEAGLLLHQAYRLHSLQVALNERQIPNIFELLHSAGIEPLLGKGWAVARLYPEPGFRPFGDFDLYVRPEQYLAAAARIERYRPWGIDLHAGVTELSDRHVDDLYRRSEVYAVCGVEVRIFGPEDHLRLLSIHMLQEGILRPLWLCDLGAALESRPPAFDWDYFLSGNKRQSQWAVCALRLASQLLGAEVGGTPLAKQERPLPKWLVPAVLEAWGRGTTPKGRRTPMAVYLRYPGEALGALRQRWPNAIEATIGVHGPFNDLPRFPFQLADSLVRGVKFLGHIPKLLLSK
jgi:hypothetical protein